MKNLFRHIAMWMGGFLKKTCLALFCLLFISGLLHAQSNSTESRVKAVFLFNFTRFVDWPASAFNSSTDPFIIGIIGKDPFGSYLEEAITGEKIGNHTITVQHFEDAKDITRCNILFIGSKDPKRVKEILSFISGRNILTVSDNPDFLSLGGIIDFFKENNKIKLQINTAAAKDAQLIISSKLLNVAQIF